jgi:hypothetical protein
VAAGHHVAIHREGKAEIQMFGDKNLLSIQEETVHESREPTAAELAYQKKNPWYPPLLFKDVRSGNLVIKLDGSTTGLPKTWGDRKRQRLHHIVDEVVVGITAVAVSLRARTLYWQEEHRKRREAQEMAAEIERQPKLIESRRSMLVSLSKRFGERAAISTFIEEVALAASEIQTPEERESLEAWLTWARDELAANDPVKELVGVVMARKG